MNDALHSIRFLVMTMQHVAAMATEAAAATAIERPPPHPLKEGQFAA